MNDKNDNMNDKNDNTNDKKRQYGRQKNVVVYIVILKGGYDTIAG